MTYSLDERATGNSINESNDVARKGEQKPRQPKLKSNSVAGSPCDGAAGGRGSSGSPCDGAAGGSGSSGSPCDGAAGGSGSSASTRRASGDSHRPAARTRRLARAVAEAGGETKGQAARLVAMGHRRLMGTPAFANDWRALWAWVLLDTGVTYRWQVNWPPSPTRS
jgi:hypothetical protein